MKNRAKIPVGKLRLNAVLEQPWQYILVDFNIKLLVLRGYNSILVVCDRFFENVAFHYDNRKNNSRRVSKVVQE